MSDEDNGPCGVVKKFFWSPRLTPFFSDHSVVLPLSAVCRLKFKRLLHYHLSVFGSMGFGNLLSFSENRLQQT